LEKSYQAPPAIPAVDQNLIPAKDDTFVSFGNFADIKKIIKSNLFYPTFITGLSGNGKTFGVEQACAALGRELIRVNITVETDEDDLIGGFRLINGETVWHNGPVIEALERGAILLLDEVDLASNKILCLQSILEGKGVFLKKIGKFVSPKTGFNVIATANTKGKGSDDGRFIGTNVLNEAFLERFPVTFEQEYPTAVTEQKILGKICNDIEFCKRLCDWADIIRKTFYDGGVDELISTRRLVHIVNAYAIFEDKAKSIEVCLNRFDDETKQAFMDLYDKVDIDVQFDVESV
jgi:midasin (ATPase involved in ribosome maturation)